MGFCKNHDHMYFDKLCRTKKQESVLSLIFATYEAKINGGSKEDIARNLKSAYELFKFSSGTFEGGIDAFASQYTIGHEMGIWINSDLDLSELAIKVAKNDITIKEYFDIVFLNYIQPIDNTTYNLLYLVTSYMSEKNISVLTKDDLRNIFSFASNKEQNEINGFYNFLICTSYFAVKDQDSLNLLYDANEISKCCDLSYHECNNDEVVTLLSDNKVFIPYLQMDHRSFEIMSSYKSSNHLNIELPITKYSGLDTENSEASDTELAEVLKQYYDRFNSIGIHLFAIDYCDVLSNRNKSSILTLANQPESYIAEINKGIKIGKELKRSSLKNREFNESNTIGYNRIYYGIPGSGKSHYVENTVLKNVDKESNVFRTTFYFDYSNTDFVGQILPNVSKDGVVSYLYTPGPFTKALERALNNNKETVYLVIEELNRGNAAAIFGDIFQLLDRKNGQSEYPISNSFIENYFEQEIRNGKKINYAKQNLVIPSNMCIVATMNTSDQNVFPLDTAFKRRWEMKRVVPNWNECEFAEKYIVGTDVKWSVFVNRVNQMMEKQSNNGITLEDKQLGPWFADADMFTDAPNTDNSNEALDKFVNKVMDYLWSDVSKFNHQTWFRDVRTFNELSNNIMKYVETNYEGSKDFCFKEINFDKEEDK